MKYNCIIILLLSFHYVLSQIFVPPSDPVIEIENIDYNDIELTSSANSSEDRVSVVEDDVQELIKRLDDLWKNNREQFEAVLSKVTGNANSIRLFGRYTLAAQCGQSIAENDFTQAREIINQIHENDYDAIIRKSFRTTPQNFRKILQFADIEYTPRNNRTLILYKELFKLARENRHNDLDDYLHMGNNIKTRYTDESWMWLKYEVWDTIIMIAKTNIAGKKYDSKYSSTILDMLFDLDRDVGARTISAVVSELYKSSELNSLIGYVLKHDNMALRTRACTAIFDNMAQNNHLHDHNLFYLGTAVRMIIRESNLDTSLMEELEKLKQRFPRSIRFAVFSWEVCLRNKKTGNYLKVSNINKEGEWRVLVSPGEHMYERSKWRFDVMDDGVYAMLKNIYLNRSVRNTGASVWMSRNYGYRIGISMPMNSGDEWLLEAADDDCYIRRPGSIQYLRDSEGSMLISDVKDDYSIWTVEKC